MKKLTAILLCLVLTLTFPTAAFAADTTTLTVEVPEAPTLSYTLSIPQNQSLTYGETSQEIGTVKLTDVQNAGGTHIFVEMKYTDFSDGNGNTIATMLRAANEQNQNGGQGDGYIGKESGRWYSTKEDAELNDGTDGWGEAMHIYHLQNFDISLSMEITDEAWKAAAPGEYTTTITYTVFTWGS